jgi:hypothetical protein
MTALRAIGLAIVLPAIALGRFCVDFAKAIQSGWPEP